MSLYTTCVRRGTYAKGSLLTSGNWGALRQSAEASLHTKKTPASGGPASKPNDAGAAVDARADVNRLQPSVIPTRHFQKSLPRLPIPPLQKTLRRYLDEVKSFSTPKQHETTAKLVKSFSEGEGAKVHEELVRTDKANGHTSFISSDWFEQQLKCRDPLPLRQHTTLLVRPDEDKDDDLLVRATLWIYSTVRYYKIYLDNVLRPDILYPLSTEGYWTSDWFERSIALCPAYMSSSVITAASNRHALPLDLSQNDNLFNSTRVPGVLQDEIRAVGFMPHITVLYRGHPFIITVADNEANALPLDQIYARLKAICGHGATSAAEEVGILTSLPRTEWSTWRTSLLRDPHNQQNLEEIETSMFVLSLDNHRDTDVFCAAGAMDKTVAVRQSNCWWDKSILVSVWNRGLSVSYEHGWCDGKIVHRYIDMVNAYSALCRGSSVPRTAAPTEPVRQLKWRLSCEQKDAVQRAKRLLQTDVDKLDTHHVALTALHAFPREDLSALIQVAVQLAWWRLQQSAVNLVEEENMSMFLRGRESKVRAASAASEAFVLAMHPHNGTVTEAQQAALLADAVKVYKARKALTLSGGGTDPHLFGLRNMCVRLYSREAALFTDELYAQHQSPTISTKSPVCGDGALLLSSPLPTRTGYGMRQRLMDEKTLLTSVSCWRDAYGPRPSSSEFATAFAEALEEVVYLASMTS